jgi:hypothetical protein
MSITVIDRNKRGPGNPRAFFVSFSLTEISFISFLDNFNHL